MHKRKVWVEVYELTFQELSDPCRFWDAISHERICQKLDAQHNRRMCAPDHCPRLKGKRKRGRK